MTVGRAAGLSAIGDTPVVRLAHLADDRCAEVWVKMEAANPTGSYKDRMALAMIEAAEADGRLRPGQLVVEPGESAVLSGRPPGIHHIEGGGIGHRPPQLDPADYEEVLAVPEARAFRTARQATRAEGIFSGPSTGANLAAAIDIAGRLGPGHRVVTIQVDSGLKYLTSQLYS